MSFTDPHDIGYRMKKLLAQLMKFGVVGIIAFIIDYGLMVLLTQIFGVFYLISATISFTVSVIFNYIASMRYVFTHKEGMSRRREFVIFVVLSVIGLMLNNALMWLGTSVAGISYLITKLFATAVVMVFNFVTRKRFLDAGDGQGANGCDGEDAASADADGCDREAPGAPDATPRGGDMRPGR